MNMRTKQEIHKNMSKFLYLSIIGMSAGPGAGATVHLAHEEEVYLSGAELAAPMTSGNPNYRAQLPRCSSGLGDLR